MRSKAAYFLGLGTTCRLSGKGLPRRLPRRISAVRFPLDSGQNSSLRFLVSLSHASEEGQMAARRTARQFDREMGERCRDAWANGELLVPLTYSETRSMKARVREGLLVSPHPRLFDEPGQNGPCEGNRERPKMREACKRLERERWRVIRPCRHDRPWIR